MLILGHRGAILDQESFHQNSLRALQTGLREADGFETDACIDSDGEIFLIHEAKYVDPACGVEYCAAEHLDAASVALLGSRRIDQLTTAEMVRLRLKDGTPLPTLRQALELTGQQAHKLIDIELKAHNVVEPVLRLAEECLRNGKITKDGFLLSSFNHPALLTVREKAPALKAGAIFVGPDQPSTPLFPWQPGSAGRYTALTAHALEDGVLQKIRPDYFIVPQEILTQSTLDMVTKNYPAAQLMAWVFTEKNNFDLPELLARLKGLRPAGKVAAMMVDNPRQFRAAFYEANRTT
jgi:glycerophosphoryl diester phosphodiesterase